LSCEHTSINALNWSLYHDIAMADQYAQYREDIDGILCDVGKLLGDLVEAPRAEVNEANALIDGHLQQFFKAYYDLKSRHDDAALSVAVMALTKSGVCGMQERLFHMQYFGVSSTIHRCKWVAAPAVGRCAAIHRPAWIYAISAPSLY
jgi:hypothetical protein